jgi:hypothetical protein
MVNLKDAQNGGEVWASVRKGIEPGSQNHILPHAALHGCGQFVFRIPLSHEDATGVVVSGQRLRELWCKASKSAFCR